MQLILPILIIGALVVINVFIPKKSETVKTSDTKVLNASSTSIPTSTPSATPTVQITNSPDVKITIHTDSPTATPQSANQGSTSDFIYPGAKITSPSGGTLNLESNDSTDTITNWYKEKIKSSGMNVTSFVTTNTNGNVNNVLAGGKNGQEIKVTITKNSGDSKVLISITGNSS